MAPAQRRGDPPAAERRLFVLQTFQLPRQFEPTAVDPRFHRAERALQNFRNLFVPQAFAEAEHEREEATDEAGLAARYGITVRVVPGDTINFKITRPDDLALAETIYARWSGA